MYDRYKYMGGRSIIIEGNAEEWPVYDDCHGDVDKKIASINKLNQLMKKETELKKTRNFYSFIDNITSKLEKHAKKLLAAYTGIALVCMLGMVIELIMASPSPIMLSILVGSTLLTTAVVGATKILAVHSKNKIKQANTQLDYIQKAKEAENKTLSEERNKEIVEVPIGKHNAVDSTEELEELKEELLLIKDYSENQRQWERNINYITPQVNERNNTTYQEDDKSVQKVKRYIIEKTTK